LFQVENGEKGPYLSRFILSIEGLICYCLSYHKLSDILSTCSCL